MPSYRTLLADQRLELPVITEDLKGKVAIVTGANTGIGLETAKHLCRLNPKLVILACRDEMRALKAIETIKHDTSCSSDQVAYWHLDQASFASVKEFATRFQESGLTLDLLICNAAVSTMKPNTTVDGWELGMQVNYISTVLLLVLLLPFVPPDGRIVTLTSVMTYLFSSAKNFREARREKTIESMGHKPPNANGKRYNVTKLLLLLMTYHISPFLTPTLTTVDPGFVRTTITEETKETLLGRLVMKWIYAPSHSRSPEMGSRPVLHAAFAPSEEVRGKYVASCRVEKGSKYARSEDGKSAAKKLWDETVEILSKVDERVPKIVSAHIVESPSRPRNPNSVFDFA